METSIQKGELKRNRGNEVFQEGVADLIPRKKKVAIAGWAGQIDMADI